MRLALGKFKCKEITKGTSSQLDFSKLSSVFVALFIEHFNIFLCLHKSIICIEDNCKHGGVVLAEIRFRIGKRSFCSSA